MKKVLKFIKNNYIYLLTFTSMLLIMGIIYKSNHVSPFGDQSLLTVDFYHQYGPMLGSFYDKVHNLSSLFYSFNIGLGGPILRNFANYLASPINLIILLFKRTNLLTSYSFIIGLKPCLAATFTTYYLTKKFNNKSKRFIPLGILYGLSAYYIAYYWNIMWLDGMCLIPLITLGIENIINNKSYKLYSISLALALISNYFIGYMLCIYSVLYFITYLIINTKFKKIDIKETAIRIFKFSASSLLAGALAAIILIPLFHSLDSISATGGSMPTSQYYECGVLDFFKGHLMGIKVTTFASDEITNPNVACGLLTIFFAIMSLLNTKVSKKERFGYLALLLVFFLIFFIPQLDFIMQAFHVPNDLPYRYSFIYSFILIIMAGYGINYLKDYKYYKYIIVYGLLIGILTYMAITNNWVDITRNMLFINMIVLTLYFIFISYIYYSKSFITIYEIVLIIIAAIEVIVPINRNWSINHDLKSFYQNDESIRNVVKSINEYEKDKFYRFENINEQTLNDGAWYNYHGITTFSSMAYENMAILQNKLGNPGNYINSYKYIEQTPIYDLMFDVKYTYGDRLDNKRYTYQCIKDDCYNKFNYNASLGYAVNKKINNWNFASDDPLDMQNDFMKNATGIESILYPLSYNEETVYTSGEKTIVKYIFDNPNEMVYFYHNDYIIDFFIIGNTLYKSKDDYDYIDDYDENLYFMVDDYQEQRIIDITSEDPEIEIYIGYNNYIRDGFLLYSIDNSKFEEAYNILNENRLNITDFKENIIIGNINTNTDSTVYTSINYDEGWKVYVDDQEVKTNPLASSLLTFDIDAGNHNIKLVYKVPYLFISTIISLISTIILLFDKYILGFIKKSK